MIGNMNEKLDIVERFDKLSPDGKKYFLLFNQTTLSGYNYGELFEDKDNEEFSRFIRDILKNQKEFMQYKVQEWYLRLRGMDLQYDPLCDHDEFEKNERIFKDIVDQMGVWSGNKECLDRQYEKIISESQK